MSTWLNRKPSWTVDLIGHPEGQAVSDLPNEPYLSTIVLWHHLVVEINMTRLRLTSYITEDYHKDRRGTYLFGIEE